MFAELAQHLKVDGRQVRVIERSATEPSSYWAKLVAAAPWLKLEHQRIPGLASCHIEIPASGQHGSIAYVGAVEAEQLRPFAEALLALSSDEPKWGSPHSERALSELHRAVDLEVYVSPACPFCATVSAAVLRFAAASPAVSVRIIRGDNVRLPEGVHTLPTVLADGVVVAEGAVDEYTLLRQISVYQNAMTPSATMPLSRPRNLPSGVRNAVPAPPEPAARSRHSRSTAA